MVSYSATSSHVADALFGKGRQRVLALLFGDPQRRLHMRQIARIAGTGLGSVQRELARLTEAGLLVREREGRQAYFRANPDCPVLGELRDLMRKTAGAADVIRDALAGLAGSIRVAAIFGSFATGTERSGSDVDLLVIGETTLAAVVGALSGAETALGREVNPVVYTPTDYAAKVAAKNHFLTSLAERKKLFVMGDESDLAAMAGQRVDHPTRGKR